MADTKLSPEQKQIFKEMKQDYPHVKFGDNGETVFAWQLMGDTVRFSTAIMSQTEKKFRRKFGQFLAIQRLVWHDQYVAMNKADFEEMLYSTFRFDS